MKQGSFVAKTLIGLIVTLMVCPLHAASDMQLDYPELTVRPLASERLLMEARNDETGRWTRFLPFQISGLATLITAGMASNDRGDNPGPETTTNLNSTVNVAYAIGGATLVASTLFSFQSHPYRGGYARISRMASKSPSEMLIRERLAEETFADAAADMKRFTYLSVLLNAGILIAISGNTQSNGRIATTVGAAFALTPLVFEHPWITTWKTHQRYKKQIYGPLGSTPSAALIPVGHSWGTGVVWNASF